MKPHSLINRAILEFCVEKKTRAEIDQMFSIEDNEPDLDDLIERNMLIKTSGGRYKTTEEGKQWLGL
jgi:predicted transcriptional regulator